MSNIFRGDYSLRQGIYPFAAPLGYLNTGKGNVKAVDQIKAPLVTKLFELYAAGDYSLDRLLEYTNQHGLTNTKDKPLCINSISLILHNPFYTGVIRIKKTGETFIGKHAPIVSSKLFEKVQEQFTNRTTPQSKEHNPIFKSLIRCKHCNYAMPGEKQKGQYYYRCHQKNCATKSIRDDRARVALEEQLSAMEYSEEIKSSIEELLAEKSQQIEKSNQASKALAKMEEGKLETQLNRLTDLLINGVLDNETYLGKKTSLTAKLQKIREQLTQVNKEAHQANQYITEIVELAFSAKESYLSAFGTKQRDIVKLFMSNFYVDGKKAIVELKKPYQRLVQLEPLLRCVHHRRLTRTLASKFPVNHESDSRNSHCSDCASPDQVAQTILDTILETYFDDC